ncbi:MAG TPA: hypothetical protein VI522_04830 [Gammaproteobacteria bacterium]|nr:hypothetical protein [Gammaproteobacteria bacterium]
MLKKLAKSLGLVSIALLFTGVSLAAELTSAQKDELINSLNLTPEQKTQVVDIMNESHTKREEITKKYANLTGAEKIKSMGPEMKKLHKDTQEKFAKVLNEEQMMKLEEMQDEMFLKAREEAKKNGAMNNQAK